MLSPGVAATSRWLACGEAAARGASARGSERARARRGRVWYESEGTMTRARPPSPPRRPAPAQRTSAPRRVGARHAPPPAVASSAPPAHRTTPSAPTRIAAAARSQTCSSYAPPLGQRARPASAPRAGTARPPHLPPPLRPPLAEGARLFLGVQLRSGLVWPRALHAQRERRHTLAHRRVLQPRK